SGAQTIVGPGAGLLAISGNNASRVFQIDAGVTAVLQNVEITGGRAAQDGSGNAQGGGIYTGGNLELDNVLIDHNSAAGRDGIGADINGNGFGGGSGQGGGLYVAGGNVLLNSTIFSSNSAQGGSGADGTYTFGLFGAEGGNGGAGQGGGVYVAGGG